MTQQDLERAIAQRTGESLKTIRRRGFSIVRPEEANFDPEPNLLPPQVIDWDAIEGDRRAG